MRHSPTFVASGVGNVHRRAVFLILAVLVVASCSPDTAAEESATSDQPVAAATSSQPTSPPATGAAMVTTTAVTQPDPNAGFGPKELDVEWDCEILDTQGNQFRFSCSNQGAFGEAREFFDAYYNGTVTVSSDEQGEPVHLSLATGGYNGDCTWGPEDGVPFEAPVTEGVAEFSGVLIGTDRCEGLKYVFDAAMVLDPLDLTWDGNVEEVG